MNDADIQIKGTCLNPRHFIPGGCLLLLALLMAGCSSMLPRTRNEASPFTNFEEARAAIDGLIPMQSDAAALTKLGIDPVQQPNVNEIEVNTNPLGPLQGIGPGLIVNR